MAASARSEASSPPRSSRQVMGLGSSKTGQLTSDELDRVQTSWKVVMENPEENGVAVFKAFLEKHNYYSKFKKFANIPIEELPESKVFRRHAGAIIQAINNVTLHIDNDSLMRSDLNALGKMHKTRNVTEEEFEELKVVLLEILESAFKLPEETLNAWNKTLTIAFCYIFEGLRGEE